MSESILDSVLENSGGAVIVSQEHDLNNINAQAALMDENELKKLYSAAEIEAMRNDPSRKREAVEAAIKRANLNVTDGKVSAAFARTEGWHGLGTTLDRPMTRVEALKYGGVDFKVVKRPLYLKNGEEFVASEDDFVFVREDTGKRLGTVGKRSQPIQNEDGFDFVDAILGEYNGHYVSVGALGDGEKIWLCAEFPEQRFEVVPGDEIYPYMVFMNRHDGKGTTRAFPSTRRPECENTLNVATGEARHKGLRIRHSGNIKAKLKAAEQAMLDACGKFDLFKHTANMLVHTPIENTAAYASDVLDAVMGVTVAQLQAENRLLESVVNITEEDRNLRQKAIAKQLKKRLNVLDEILNAYESQACGVSGIRGTKWAAFNAVTQYADHGLRYRGERSEENRFESNLYGKSDEMKHIALETILERSY